MYGIYYTLFIKYNASSESQTSDVLCCSVFQQRLRVKKAILHAVLSLLHMGGLYWKGGGVAEVWLTNSTTYVKACRGWNKTAGNTVVLSRYLDIKQLLLPLPFIVSGNGKTKAPFAVQGESYLISLSEGQSAGKSQGQINSVVFG